jgi:hypothetical protein
VPVPLLRAPATLTPRFVAAALGRTEGQVLRYVSPALSSRWQIDTSLQVDGCCVNSYHIRISTLARRSWMRVVKTC